MTRIVRKVVQGKLREKNIKLVQKIKNIFKKKINLIDKDNILNHNVIQRKCKIFRYILCKKNINQESYLLNK